MKKICLLFSVVAFWNCSDYVADWDDKYENVFSNTENPGEDLFSSSSSVQSFDNYPSPISSSDFFNDYNPIASSSSSEFYLSSSEVIISSFRDSRDGKSYKVVKIGNQVWMAENLNYQTNNSYCYDNILANCQKYGRLYTWEAALNVCPTGWHLPTEEEFETLISNVGGIETAGKMLKSMIGWGENGNGVDAFGFSVLPAGRRSSNGLFNLAGEGVDFWSATEDGELYAYSLTLLYDNENAGLGNRNKDIAVSVRCLQTR